MIFLTTTGGPKRIAHRPLDGFRGSVAPDGRITPVTESGHRTPIGGVGTEAYGGARYPDGGYP